MYLVLSLLALALALLPLVLPFLDGGERAATEAFFFEGQESSLLALGLVLFLLWKRRGGWLGVPDPQRRGGSDLAGIALAGLAVATLFWSRFVSAPDLYAFGVVLFVLSACAIRKGFRSLGVFGPAPLVALLILPMPTPIYNEVVWAAQRLATTGAAWILEALGRELTVGSMLIRLGQHDFWVIETCSGLRSVELLTLMAVLIVELSPDRRRREWGLVALAVPIAIALNVLRIVAVVLYDTATANEADHTLQGLMAVFVGTGLLFLIHRRVFAAPTPSASAPRADPIGVEGLGELLAHRGLGALALVGLLAILIGSAAQRPLPTGVDPQIDDIPSELATWTSSDQPSGRLFFNTLPIGRSLHRAYERPRGDDRPQERVDLYVAQKRLDMDRRTLVSSKYGWLGPDWHATRIARTDVWPLEASGVLYRSTRGPESFLVLVFAIEGDGAPAGILRSSLALDRVAGSDRPRFRVIRLSTSIRGGRTDEHAQERAETTLRQFLQDLAPVVARGRSRASAERAAEG